MPNVEKLKIISEFYGGIVRDDKSKIRGAASNVEELDIFGNQDFIQAEQIFSSDAMPASTEIYAYTSGDDDTVYGYGQDTTSGAVRIVSVANGGADNPGAFATLFTSADTTDDAIIISDFKFFRTSEANPTYLYYIKGTSSTWKLQRYDITGDAEGTEQTLSGLDGSFDRPTIKVIYGELFICHGQFIAKVDKDGGFTEKAFTLPIEWEAIDIIPVSDIAIILCRNKNRLINESRGFWWDLTSTSTFKDSFTIPMGGPQWIVNHKETIKVCTAINGIMRIWQMSGAFPGAVPLQLPGILLDSIGAETSTQPISSPKMVAVKDKILYFGLFKTDKTGVYAIGQIDDDKPNALILSKRFDTSDYSLHKPTALLIQGRNYYAAFDDNGTADNVRCETNNSPTRSSNAVYESVWIDDDKPFQNKQLVRAYLASQPLSASTSLDLQIATDYGTSFTSIKRADNSVFNTANGLLGLFRPAAFNNKKSYQAKVAFTSNTTNSPKLVAIGLRMIIKDLE